MNRKWDPDPKEPLIARRSNGETFGVHCGSHSEEGYNHDVFLAVDKAGQKYALRVLSDELMRDHITNRSTVNTFLDGCSKWLLLEHKNILRAHALGHPDDQTQKFERPFVLTEFFEGQQLSKMIKEQKLPSLEQTLNIALDVCDALAYAKQQYIFHGNLKPTNIFLHESDGKIVAKVSDFGCSDPLFRNIGLCFRVLGPACTFNAYVSPEYITGKEMNEASDVYSMGCILYECLAGRTPFPSEKSNDMFVRQVKETPKPFSADHVPESVVAIVMKALEKDPENRWQSMEELSAAIKAFQNQN